VWAIEPRNMQCDWLGERVATVDVTRAISNVLHGKEDAGWGPNAVFRFPLEGGTGGIWKAVASVLPQKRLVSTTTASDFECQRCDKPGGTCGIIRKAAATMQSRKLCWGAF